jgi:uncharacterized membrane protein YccF (DUF307 family)
MQQPPSQDPPNSDGQLWQVPSYEQPEQPSGFPSQVLPPVQPEGLSSQQQGYPQQQQRYQQPMQQPVYNPAMQSNPYPQQQGYPQQQQMYQQPMQPVYNPAMQGSPYPQQQQMYQQPMQQPLQVTSVNVNVDSQQKNSGCVRAIYFVFIGWWLGFWCLQIGFLLCAFILTLPVGLMLLNRLPQIMTLKPPTKTVNTNVNVTSVSGVGGATNVVSVNVNVSGPKQHPMILRILYYFFIGWWAGYLWANLGYFLCLSIIGLPLGIIILNQLPVVLTLRKN